MELYKIGKIVSVGKRHILFENNSSGWMVYIADPEKFKKNELMKLYVYNYKNEYVNALYGFTSFKERILFYNLIQVPGVGPKTALNLLKLGSDYLIDVISKKDSKSLLKCTSIGERTSNQIIFELSEKYKRIKTHENKLVPTEEIKKPLKDLGFNKSQVNFALKHIKPEKNIESMIEKAIVLISNGNISKT